ncbi:DUF4397 domain-containing protein [Anaerobacillus sp. MEB173]|uniref:DUF4397 domain-containing protein n=1 Tax=Anaerobacillus sp. MEB173 TaxID=3383345 RepID=UPI003F915A2F
MYHYFPNTAKIMQDCATYDLLANYFKYIDPAKHIHYYQLHFMCIQQMVHAQQMQYTVNPYHMSQPHHIYQPKPVRYQREQRQQGPAKVRVFHTSPDAPAVDVYINDKETPIHNMPYYQISGYLELPAGSHEITIYPAGQKNQPVLTESVTVESGVSYTISAAGRLSDIQLVIAIDQEDVPANQALLRFWHLSPNAPDVDIVQNDEVLFEGVSFQEATNYLELSPMTTTIEIRRAGTDDVVMTLRNLTLTRNEAYTIVAMGLVDGTPKFEATIIQP